MKLCADILYWRLKEKLTTVTQRGKGGSRAYPEPAGILSGSFPIL